MTAMLLLFVFMGYAHTLIETLKVKQQLHHICL